MKRTHWSGKLGFVLATAGSAVGLGNVWRFPYLAGQNGGGSFLLLYLLCVFGLGFFILLAKLSFGRTAQTNIVDGFQVVAEKNKKSVSRFWGWLGGFFTVLNTFLVGSIYVIVIGWTLFYFYESLCALFGLSSQSVTRATFEGLTSSFSRQLFWGVVCVGLTVFVLLRGVRQGIEKISLYLMPVLFFLLVFMAIWIVCLPNTFEGLRFYLTPDWTAMGFTQDGFHFQTFASLLIKVLGQVIYSISLGMGVMFVYGSYLSVQENLIQSAKWIVILDTLVAFISGLIVLPAVFAFGGQPDAGPSLTFITLPDVFQQIHFGGVFMFLFFALLFIAALTSLISIYEPVVNLLMEKINLKRWQGVILVACVNLLGTVLVLLSFTDTVFIRIGNKNLFDFVDMLTGSVTMSAMVLFLLIFMGWVVSSALIRNLGQGLDKPLSKFFKRYVRFVLRFLGPLVLLALFINLFADL